MSNANQSQISLHEVYAKVLDMLQRNDHVAAERFCLLSLKTADFPDAQLWFYLGVARQFQGQLVSALSTFEKANILAPQAIDVVNARASCLGQLDRYQEAHDLLNHALSFAGNSPAIHANLAVALEHLGKGEEALSRYDYALSIEPENKIALINRGTLLGYLGRRPEWLAHNRHAYALLPGVFATLYNLVDALIGMFLYEEALKYCDIGLADIPGHGYLLFKKGMALSCLHRFDEAQRYLSEAQIIQPSIIKDLLPNHRGAADNISIYADAKILYFDAMYEEQLSCHWEHREKYLETLNGAIRSPEEAYAVVNNPAFGFQLFSLDIDAKTRLKLTKNIGDQIQDVAWVTGLPPFKSERKDKKRLRIGYVSPDFRRHPTGLLTRQIYGMHDRQLFEIIGYSLKASDDPIQEDISKSCDEFYDISMLTAVDAAQKIYADDIDILIDLAGYTTHSRTEIFAFRPAPLQVSYVGFVESMGADFIDYVVTDANIYPPGGESYWHEQVIRMPHHVLPYDNQTDNVSTQAKRSDFDLPDDAFVFCCLNNSYKIEPKIFDVWANILKAVPDSVLWLLDRNEQTKTNLQNEAKVRGIASERLVFAPVMNYKEHLSRYQMADLFLDTIWHNAHTTALEALWQGLPLLTCEGNVASARLAASCLRVLGLPELVTSELVEYERRAIDYALNPQKLTNLREKLKVARYTSPLFNTALTVRHLEYAYQAIWQRYREGKEPIGIDIPDLGARIH